MGQAQTQALPVGQSQPYGVNPNTNAANGMQQAFNMTSGAANNYNNFAAQGGGTYNPTMMGGAAQSQAQGYGASVAGIAGTTAQGFDAAQGNAAMSTAQGYDPSLQSNAQDISTGISQYQNPYQQQVIDNTAADMNRNLAMQQNQTGADASAAGAFGGSRHGLVEAENMAQTNRAIGDMSAANNAQGFNTAAALAGQDISNDLSVASQNQNASNQSGQFGAASQNANNQFNAGNNQAMNMQNTMNQQQSSQFGAGAQNTANQYNASNQQQGNQFNAGASNAADQFGASANNANSQYNAGNRQQGYLADQNAQNQAAQFNAGSTSNNMNSMFQNQLAAGGQLGDLASNSFGMGNQISNNQMNSGGMTQALQQQIMDQGQGMYDQWAQQPENILQMRLASLGMNPLNNATTTTNQSDPGWGSTFGNLLGAAGNAFSFAPIALSSAKFKEDVQATGRKVRSVSGKVVDEVTYRYRNSPKTEVGIIAEHLGSQDAAVINDEYDKPFAVDYSKLEVV
jgi:hypothetical protein